MPSELPPNIQEEAAGSSHRTAPGYLSEIADDELDSLILRLCSHYSRAGIRMLDGMLRRLGCIVPYEHIRLSLIRIDPVHRVFEQIRIRRRGYSVPGPNFLWHHDGQHGLIRWGIIIHGFIDGHSRLITALQASNNNRAETVLLLFLAAAAIYGIPSRVRGDHGVENIWVAAFMEHCRGAGRGSYIWGRSVHNVRIERLWVDVKVGVGSTWSDRFLDLELNYGLDISNVNHVWLVQWLFLPVINEELKFWADSWNHHKLNIKNGPNRSPHDIFGFDMLVHGMRGDALSSYQMSDEELEVFGVDWDGLHDEKLLQSLRENYKNDGKTSWVGRQGPPPHLATVKCDPPPCSLTSAQVQWLEASLQLLPRGSQQGYVTGLWVNGLALARQVAPNLF